MKTIRKALAMMLALCIVLSLAACGNKADAPASNPPAENSEPAAPESKPVENNEPSTYPNF